MKQPESDQKNQQKCDKCGKIVGCDYQGREHKCGCKVRKHKPTNFDEIISVFQMM